MLYIINKAQLAVRLADADFYFTLNVNLQSKQAKEVKSAENIETKEYVRELVHFHFW